LQRITEPIWWGHHEGNHSAEACRLGKQTLCQLSYSRSGVTLEDSVCLSVAAILSGSSAGHNARSRRHSARTADNSPQRLLADVRHPRREHVEAFIIDLLVRWKPATANSRYRGCQAFFRWCLEVEIIEHSPMARDEAPEGARLARPGPPPRRRREADRHVYASGSATTCAPRKIG
jgi:hypothetical protein